MVKREFTSESAIELKELMDSVINKMLETSCPCKYKQFVDLVTFYHANLKAGPVFCADTNYLISAAVKNPDYLIEKSKISENCLGDYQYDFIYQCCKCESLFITVGKQYSVSFEFEYMIAKNLTTNFNFGQKNKFPFLLYQGFFGFDLNEIEKCSKNYKIAAKQEVFNYLTSI
jgi:hypothetical protein